MARDYRGLVLALLALAGGTVWMPLFSYLDLGALPGAAGVVFGLLGIRSTSWGFSRVLAILGLLGGGAGVVMQTVWIVFEAVR
ncbi:hypothetical protein AB0J86_28120 [Micromonospora sp. NPDC049559]|uniref:hypothetical protein n=1 Tax=Micromonospora sp. NPDC049559 TaxID=3155923 RepID=UPI0034298DF8